MTQNTGELSTGKKSFYFLGMIFFLLFSIPPFGYIFTSIQMAQVIPNFYIYAGLFGIIMMGGLFASFMFGYKVFRPLTKHGWIKKKLVFTVSLYFIIGMGVTVGFPNTLQYVQRGMNYQAKTDLSNFYQACNKYWETNGKNRTCSIETVANQQYEFVQSDHIWIKGQGTPKNFTATAKHSHTNVKYTIDAKGDIVEKFITF